VNTKGDKRYTQAKREIRVKNQIGIRSSKKQISKPVEEEKKVKHLNNKARNKERGKFGKTSGGKEKRISGNDGDIRGGVQ